MKICKLEIDQRAIRELEQKVRKGIYDDFAATLGKRLSIFDFRFLEYGDKNIFPNQNSKNNSSFVVPLVYHKVSLESVFVNINGEIDVDRLKESARNKIEDTIANRYHQMVADLNQDQRDKLLLYMFAHKPIKVVLGDLPKIDMELNEGHVQCNLYFGLGMAINLNQV